MAESSIFWTTGTTGDGAATYTEAQTTAFFGDILTPNGTITSPHATQGVLRGVGSELAVSGTSSPVAVAAGAAITEGYAYRNTAAVNVTVPTPGGATRIDRIVLRVSHSTTRTVRITRIAGTEGAGSAPAITQSAGTTWDIKLAQVSITTGGVITVTDERAFAQFATNHVKRDGDTMTGSLNITPSGTTNAGIELGSISGASTPFIDIHSSGNNIDYDSRIIASGGSGSIGQGIINIIASALQWGGIGLLQIFRRQGGSATSWSSPGTTAYTPGAVRVQTGAIQVNAPTSTAITFPVAFSQVPLVICSADAQTVNAGAGSVTASGFTLLTGTPDYGGSPPIVSTISWIAIGTE